VIERVVADDGQHVGAAQARGEAQAERRDERVDGELPHVEERDAGLDRGNSGRA
jgi:hypothetical protein